MKFQNAKVFIYADSDDPIVLEGVSGHFRPGDHSLYVGADESPTIIRREGWLALQTDEFKGWYSAYVIEVTLENDQDNPLLFEVNRNFHIPRSEDGRLWFPVMPMSR